MENFSDTHRKILDTLYKLQQENIGLNWIVREDSFSQRRITEESRVSQSTVSDNKTFLVKSAKLVREQ